MSKADWIPTDAEYLDKGWVPPEDVVTDDARIAEGWTPPDEKADMLADLEAKAFNSVAKEFERLVALDEIPRFLGDKIVGVIKNELRYGRR